MAKVTITISDEWPDGVRFRAEFDPPIKQRDEMTSAQAVGLLAADYTKDLLEGASVGEADDDKEPISGSQAN